MSINLLFTSRCARMLPGLMLSIGLVLCGSLRSQPGSQAAALQAGRASSFRVDTELVTAEVTVLDKKGNPVRNLKEADFQLFEDGRQQEIASFAEVTEDPHQPLPTSLADIDDGGSNQGKVVLILFDDSNIAASDLKITRDSAEKFVKDHMKPQDLFAVATYGLSLRILQSFTPDTSKIVEAIRRPAQGAPGMRGGGSGIPGTQASDIQATSLLRSLSLLSASVEPVKSRKTVLIYSGDFAVKTNIQREYMKTLESARRADLVYYTVDTKGLSGATGGGPLIDNATGETTGSASSRTNPNTVGFGSLLNQSAGDVLRSLANETGGFAIFDTSEFSDRLDRVDQEIGNYYVLGFQSNNPRLDGKFRKLEIKTGLRGVTIKHRDGYVDRRPVDALASTREEKSLMEVMASPTAANQLPITFRAAYCYDSRGLASIPVTVKVRTTSLELKERSGQLGTDLNVMGIAYAEDGSMPARFSETLHVLIGKEEQDAFRKEGLTYGNYIKLRPGRYRLKVAVADDKGKVGSADQTLEVPVLPESGPAASSLIVAGQITPLPELIQNVQAQLLDERDPLIFGGLRVLPSVDNTSTANAPVLAFYKVYNLDGKPDQWKFVAKVQLVNEQGEAQVFPPIPLDQSVTVTSRTGISVGIKLPFGNVAPGKYRLLIETLETTSNQSVSVQTDLNFR